MLMIYSGTTGFPKGVPFNMDRTYASGGASV
jgi:acyl-CoA synthetase (AMP-forming)/AMP-acid ligase II